MPTPISDLLHAHRSIRTFEQRAVDADLIDRILVDSLQGSSSSGNLNMVSVIKTFDAERKARLCDLHFGQPMVNQAPLVLTFCADSFRTRQWLAQRDARLNFGNLISWYVASFDAIILSQTVALTLESYGLGICYMGTTLHSMAEISEFLECPDHCLPVTSMVVGWPGEVPAQRDRMPARAWIHNERYQRPGAHDIDDQYKDREVNGWNRYRGMGEDMVKRMDEHGITSLAQYYTSDLKYAPQTFERDSQKLQALMKSKGFMAP